jgi:hypothetical protein
VAGFAADDSFHPATGVADLNFADSTSDSALAESALAESAYWWIALGQDMIVVPRVQCDGDFYQVFYSAMDLYQRRALVQGLYHVRD